MTEEEVSSSPDAYRVHRRMPDAARDTSDAQTASVEAVAFATRNTLAAAQQAGSSAVGAVTHVALKAIREGLAIGRDLNQAGKAIVMGILQARGHRGEEALLTISQASRTIVHHTALTGRDVTRATTGLVEGAIQSALDVGVDVTRAASAAAQGALEGAEAIGFVAAQQVRAALKDRFHGVRILLLSPYQEQER